MKIVLGEDYMKAAQYWSGNPVASAALTAAIEKSATRADRCGWVAIKIAITTHDRQSTMYRNHKGLFQLLVIRQDEGQPERSFYVDVSQDAVIDLKPL